MNGRFLLDTNAVIALLNGNSSVGKLLQTATWIGIPIIVELEFLSFANLSKSDEALFTAFKNRVEVIGLDASDTVLIEKIIQIRRIFNIKLPDSIIAAIAIQQQGTLLSNDVIFQRVSVMNVQGF
ncbi:MAG: PIN domain-containing protein [Saprospiraceae bacterium]|nr:PIN domain-containing protein [Saprospiraceae bacterium]